MPKGRIAATALEVVVFAVLGFGSSLLSTAPPAEAHAGTSVAVNLTIVLVALSTLVLLARTMRLSSTRMYWLLGAIAFIGLAIALWSTYSRSYRRHVVPYPYVNPPVLFVAGTELTEPASAFLQKNPASKPDEILVKFGGLQGVEQVWTAESLQQAREELAFLFAMFVASIAAAIFSLIEAAMAGWRSLGTPLVVAGTAAPGVATPMAGKPPAWDIFLAHAGVDREAAEQLYDLFGSRVNVFLDTKSLKLGDEWDRALQQAQRDSLVTVVLISHKSGQGFYNRDEMAAARELAKEQAHRIVPLYLYPEGQHPPEVPYGLRIVHGMHVVDDSQLAEAADRICQLVAELRSRESPRGATSVAER